MAEGKYRDMAPEAVARVYAEKAGRFKREKDADKAARAQLHAISGAYVEGAALARARQAMRAYLAGDAPSLQRALSMHASTRERLPVADALFDRAFARCPGVKTVLDLACGLNPLYLAARGVKGVTGVDMHMGCVNLINDCAREAGWDARARAGDLILSPPEDECDLALMMKLLPVLETQKAGAARALLALVRAKYALVSFPTRTLGGKSVGMEAHYSRWFDSIVPDTFAVTDRFIMGSELIYLLERKCDAETVCGRHADWQPCRPEPPHDAGAFGV